MEKGGDGGRWEYCDSTRWLWGDIQRLEVDVEHSQCGRCNTPVKGSCSCHVCTGAAEVLAFRGEFHKRVSSGIVPSFAVAPCSDGRQVSLVHV
jgi:hypothetical protein